MSAISKAVPGWRKPTEQGEYEVVVSRFDLSEVGSGSVLACGRTEDEAIRGARAELELLAALVLGGAIVRKHDKAIHGG